MFSFYIKYLTTSTIRKITNNLDSTIYKKHETTNKMKTIKNDGSNDNNNKNTKMSQQQRDNNFF